MADHEPPHENAFGIFNARVNNARPRTQGQPDLHKKVR